MFVLIDIVKFIDNQFFCCYIDLDFVGYWLVMVEWEVGVLKVEYYSNDINDQGLVVDLEMGEVIVC